eukprot:834904-Pyramimonas_sp.AAC.1
MVAVCFTWDWPVMAALLLAGFTMSLKPDELLSARRCDLLLPSDCLESSGNAWMTIPDPVSSMSYPPQHAWCSDKAVVRVLEMVFRHLGPTDPLSTFGQSGFRT